MVERFEKNTELESFLQASIEALEMANHFHISTWHIDQCDRWTINQKDGKINFYLPNKEKAIAPVQIIGTYSFEDNSFLWCWSHPNVDAPLQQAAWAVKAFADQKNYEELQQRKVNCTEERAWAYSALAMRLSKYSGAYKTKLSDDTLLFLIFDAVTIK